MSTVVRPVKLKPEDPIELHTGDRMNREEFHRAYKQTPDGFKAELIGGIVYLASPLKRRHGAPHLALGGVLFNFMAATPGIDCGDNVTVLLGNDAEPQPDLFARILPEYGGQSNLSADDYISGAPEFVVEIALSSRSIDLHAKRNDYMRNGVQEYLVVCIAENELRWFDLRQDRELSPDADKIYRIHSFPGLWIDAEALLKEDGSRLLATLQQGLASPEHADFVIKLAATRKT